MSRTDFARLIRSPQCVFALAALTVLLFALGCWGSYARLRVQQQSEMRQQAQHLLTAFEVQSTRLLDYADGYLRALRAYHAEHPADAQWEHFVQEVEAPNVERFSGIVTLVGKDGWTLYQSQTPRSKLQTFGNMADLDHYQYFIKQPGDSLFIGPTRLGRMTGKQQFRVARPILKDGRFDGLLVLTLLPEQFTDLYHGTALGAGSMVMVVTRQQELIAQLPPRASAMAGAVALDLQQSLGLHINGAKKGVAFGVRSPADGLVRDIFFSRLPDYPVTLLVGLAQDDVDAALADARRTLVLLTLAFACAALVVSLLVLSMQREHRHLVDAKMRLRTLFDASPDAQIITDAQGVITMANAQVTPLLGYAPQELIGQAVEMLVPTSTRLLHPALRKSFMVDPSHRRMGRPSSVRALRKDGRLVDVDITLSRISSEDGMQVAASLRDATERKHAEEELRIAAAAFESEDGVVVTDANSVILRVNQAFTEITGYSAEEAIGQTPRILKSDRHDHNFYREMWASIHATGKWRGEIWDRRKNGEIFSKWLNISAVKNAQGDVTHYIGSQFDITERKLAEERIQDLAFYDQLTGLPNRTLLQDRLKQALASSARSAQHGALLLIDLDNFKTLNDTHGHDAGDALLKQVAQQISRCVREGDTVARLGGDEFVVILVDLDGDAAQAAANTRSVASKILDAMNQDYQVGRASHHNAASIGATLFTGDGVGMDALMKQADLSMYKAKTAGRNAVHFFDPALEVAIREHAALEDGLRLALKNGHFELYYQVQVDGQGHATGAEALVRWHHPQRGLIGPGDFIPLAEDTGLIVPLGRWVLQNACQQLARWAQQAPLEHLTLAVNVSARQLQQPNFVQEVLDTLARTGAPAHKLKLELTESLLAHNMEDTITLMGTLKNAGVGFSLDDFGTGYSSLSYLKRLPLDQLKIDRSFVRDVLSDPNDAAIAKTVVALAHSLGLTVIAEGVETTAQREFLARSGCHACQGYLFGRPQPAKEFEQQVMAGMGHASEDHDASLHQPVSNPV